MNRKVVHAIVGSGGRLLLDLSLGAEEAGREVRVIVESVPPVEKQRGMSAADLLRSGLVGIWADRMDIVPAPHLLCQRRLG